MTDTRVDLGEYEGRPITMSSVVIPSAGGGLYDALALDPVLLHSGDEVTIALRCKVEDINHALIKYKGEDTGNYNRVAKLVVAKGLIIDGATVASAFAALNRRLELVAEENGAGRRIPGIDGEEET